MSSNVAASCPSSSSESARIAFEKSPAATLRAARSSRLIRPVRARDVPGERGQYQRDRPGDEDPLADQLDVRLHVGQ
jgi:hypothetical protein